ncbi:DUF3426 domain-containing protein [Pseudomonas boanensis]|uniref:DUF3426 domain-containing protein n=1 Tax=Metapseudomonas boanensis TaxID=2822138 RepID=UPI0035D4D9D7
MTDSFVTQCPHCQTSFRVSRAQLAVANGAVRCGACLHVFNAAQQLLAAAGQAVPPQKPESHQETPRPASTQTKPAPPPTTPPLPASAVPSVAAVLNQAIQSPADSPSDSSTSDTQWIHDDLDLDSLDLDEELAKLEQEERRLSRDLLGHEPPLRSGLEVPEPAPTPAPAPAPEEAAEQPADEGWAEALIREVEERGTEPPQPPLAPEPVAVTPATLSSPAAPTRTEPSLSLDMVEDEPGPDFSLGGARDDEPEILADDDHDDEPEAEPRESARAQRSEPGLRDDGLLNLNDEPLQLDWQQPKRPWGRWIGWGLLNLLGAGALATQYVWYHFDELARQDQYRPWFAQICPEIGCQLPSKVDIDLIKSSNLVVRSHPDFSGALVVDAILYNRASFSQPFPLLELRFADMSGQLLASRRFKPGEYLSGELAGQGEMPPQTPIHISLDILDPGAKAVNYSLSFHSPE